MKKHLLVLFCLVAFALACKKKSLVPQEMPASINMIAPTSGLPGTEVTITGANFGTIISDVSVKINGTPAEVLSVTNETIRIKVKTATTSGKLVITVKGVEVTGPDFAVTNVQLTALNPKSSALTGEIVTLTGNNFGTDKNKVSVFFGTIPAEITEITNTSIKVKVPAAFEEGKIKLQVLDDVVESSTVFSNDVSGIVDETFTNIMANTTAGKVNTLASNGQFIFVGTGTGHDGGLMILDMQGNLVKKFSPTDGFTDPNSVEVETILVHPTNPNRIYIGGGQFNKFDGHDVKGVVSLIYTNGEWVLDQNFNTSMTENSTCIAFQMVGNQLKLLVGVQRNYGAPLKIIRLNDDGSNDPTFNTGIFEKLDGLGASSLGAILVEPGSNGKIFVGGGFNTYNGTPVQSLICLNTDGSLNYSVNLNLDITDPYREIHFMKFDDQNNIFITGRALRKSNEYGIMKIDRNTGVSSSLFKVNTNQYGSIPQINYLSKTRRGKYIILGEWGFNRYANSEVKEIVRVNQDGTLDTGFGENGTLISEPVSRSFYTSLLLPDGKILVGGNFRSISGKTYNGLVRIK